MAETTMADLRVRTAPDPAALDAALARPDLATGADLADGAVPAPPSCRTPMPAPDEAPWRRRLRVARSWWCAFVSGLG